MTWTPRQTYLAAALSAHVGWMPATVWAFGLIHIPAWAAVAVLLAIATLKEVVVDPIVEGNKLWTGNFDSGAGDLVGYALGAALVFGLQFASTHL